ncbi:MAG: DUF1844 domain-containing protein [Candidatus Omnitrophota bacterium]
MDNEKYVDESWKDDVAGDNCGCSDHDCGCSNDSCADGSCQGGCGDDEMRVNFFNYLTSMGYQTMIFLGEIPNPMTGQNEKNLRQAKFIIDTLLLIKEKTKGNLTQEENSFLEGTLHELQMKFVELSSKEGSILS